MSELSQRIRHYRKKKGLTQMDVAASLGIRVDNYSKYETGARVPRDDRLVKLSKILGVSYNTLNEGVEREFLDLLNRHALGAVMGDSGGFSAFISDMEISDEPNNVLAQFFIKGEHCFAVENPEFYSTYMAHPNLAGLIALYEMYREQCDSHTPEKAITVHYLLTPLESASTLKWAFFNAVHRYLYLDTNTLLDEIEELAGDLLEHIDALQFFAVKVFVPYLSFIIDAVDLCMNTTIDDFELAFLFYALTPPEENDENSDTDEDEDE